MFYKQILLFLKKIDFTNCKLYNKFMNKIRELRKLKKITMKELGQILNLSESTISLYENGKHEPDYATLKKIADYFMVSTDYLLGRNDDTKEKNKGVLIPVLGEIRAGSPMWAEEDIIDYEEIPEVWTRSGEFFGLKIKGDSMAPRIKENDVVIFKKQDYAENGDVCAVLINGEEATIKNIKIIDNGIVLIANNPAYPPMVFTDKQIKELPVQIIGKAVELRGKF